MLFLFCVLIIYCMKTLIVSNHIFHWFLASGGNSFRWLWMTVTSSWMILGRRDRHQTRASCQHPLSIHGSVLSLQTKCLITLSMLLNHFSNFMSWLHLLFLLSALMPLQEVFTKLLITVNPVLNIEVITRIKTVSQVNNLYHLDLFPQSSGTGI